MTLDVDIVTKEDLAKALLYVVDASIGNDSLSDGETLDYLCVLCREVIQQRTTEEKHGKQHS